MALAGSQRTTPNVTVDFAGDASGSGSEPMEQSGWAAGAELCVSSRSRSRSNSCSMVEQLPLDVLSYENRCPSPSNRMVDTSMQYVCKSLKDGLRLNVPQARKDSHSTGQLPLSETLGKQQCFDEDDDDRFSTSRPQSAMSSRMQLQDRWANGRNASGSAASSHHNRSQSVRAPKRPTYLSPPRSCRPRGTSLPGGATPVADGSDDECYLLRHFIVNGKNVVNRGDSFRNRKTPRGSATSVQSSTSSARFEPTFQFSCYRCTSSSYRY